MPRTIHIVDDDDLARDVIASLVGTLPGVTVHAWDSAERFLAAAQDGADPGVVLLDLNMPGLSGNEALKSLDHQRFAAIIVSGQGEITSAVESLKRGAIDFIEKPFTLEKLLGPLKVAFQALDRNLTAERTSDHNRERLDTLSEREVEILSLLVDGLTNREVAEKLGLSVRTVESHRARIMLKLDVSSFAEAIRLAVLAGIETPR
ncbi:response regulator transcription factor [Sphingomonas suaedae]|uniref:Response regulator transcription factor n=1 Tax=Sphingomonas suaedae TaxID=2599297 RepID=A0A518RE78_9SPHN|nr:response regulator [Sphingomonas suaedae]QDX25721.1 response regulator transcription factor [Sphingomonas suaedae]